MYSAQPVNEVALWLCQLQQLVAGMITEISSAVSATTDIPACVFDNAPYLWDCMTTVQSLPGRIDDCPSDTALCCFLMSGAVAV